MTHNLKKKAHEYIYKYKKIIKSNVENIKITRYGKKIQKQI